MRGISIRITRIALLAICLVLFFQPTASAQISEAHFEALTDESTQWTIYLMGQQIGYAHFYGNFSYKVTYTEPPIYVLFFLNETVIVNETEYHIDYLLANATSEPYECSFSTLDYSIGLHDFSCLTCYEPSGPLVGGGSYYFFEHQDRSGEQVLYDGISITVVAANIVGFFGVVFACHRLAKWWYSSRSGRPSISHFERVVAAIL